MPGWQKIYEQEKDKNFEIIAVAEDTGGAQAAGPWIEKATPGYTALIDDAHVVSRLYGLVNVPNGIWIDEKGRMVRPPEVAFTDDRYSVFTHFSSVPYLNALRDWIDKGDKSVFALSEDEMRKRLTPESPGQLMAATEFTLAEYLHKEGHPADAINHFKSAQQLDPDNWNFKRQAWALDQAKAKQDYGTSFADEMKKSKKPFYPAPDIPSDKQQKDNR